MTTPKDIYPGKKENTSTVKKIRIFLTIAEQYVIICLFSHIVLYIRT